MIRKTDKYGYLTDKDAFLSNQRKIIEKAKFMYSLLEKAFEKQTKTIQQQEKNEQMILQTKTKD